LLTLLRETRQRAGLSQQHVADRLGRPQSFVAKYEGGERRLDVLEFISVAKALGVDPARLFREFLRRKA
jgi:transcriptional regulator with XRE-family HTH domain